MDFYILRAAVQNFEIIGPNQNLHLFEHHLCGAYQYLDIQLLPLSPAE